MQKRLECKIEGLVQLVMFRDFVNRNATKLGLGGIVQNMKDGSVYVIAEGEEEKLRKLLVLLQKGPIFARVEDVQEKWVEPIGEFSSFNIVYK
jgi:acylphosphatase